MSAQAAGRMAELYGGEVCFKRDEKRCCTLHNSKQGSETFETSCPGDAAIG